jgi:hypothetical protein
LTEVTVSSGAEANSDAFMSLVRFALLDPVPLMELEPVPEVEPVVDPVDDPVAPDVEPVEPEAELVEPVPVLVPLEVEPVCGLDMLEVSPVSREPAEDDVDEGPLAAPVVPVSSTL